MSEDITVNELYQVLKSMCPSSAPGNDGITVKFYLHFWDLIKDDLFNCISHSLVVGKLSPSQRQGIINLIPSKEAIWLDAELFLGHHDGSCHGLW